MHSLKEKGLTDPHIKSLSLHLIHLIRIVTHIVGLADMLRLFGGRLGSGFQPRSELPPEFRLLGRDLVKYGLRYALSTHVGPGKGLHA